MSQSFMLLTGQCLSPSCYSLNVYLIFAQNGQDEFCVLVRHVSGWYDEILSWLQSE